MAKSNIPFSQELTIWLKGPKHKTVGGLTRVASEKSFALLLLVLMALPALPLPTAGLSHVFEIIAMLLAIEMIAGRKSIWLPKKTLRRKLGPTIQFKTLPYLIGKIKWLEKYTKPRGSRLLTNRLFLRLVGLVVFLLCIGAFVAPPFTGLDTLPALGVVGIALGLILEDILVLITGVIVGGLGIVAEIGFGSLITIGLKKLYARYL